MRAPRILPAAVLASALVLAGCQPSGQESLLRGDAALQAGQSEEAIRWLERAARLLPAEAEAWNRLGLAYHHASRLDDAEKAYQRALHFNRDLFDAHFNLGELHLEQGRHRDAEAAFRTYLNASQANTQNPDAWRGLGLAFQAQRQHANADVALGNATRLNSSDPLAWNALGVTRLQLKRHRDAHAAFVNATKLDPQLAAAQLNLAIVLHHYLANPRDALPRYQAFLSLQPGAPEAAQAQAAVRDLSIRLGLVAPPASTPAPVAQASAPTAATNQPAANAAATKPSVAQAPAKPISNPPPAPTNPPPRVAAAAPVPTAVAPASNTPPRVAAVPSPRPTPKAEPPPAPQVVAPPVASVVPVPAPPPSSPTPPPTPPLEIVAVTDDAPPKPAVDPAPPPVAIAAPTLPAPSPAQPSVPKVEPEANTDPVPGQRPSTWKKLNPVSWGNPVGWFRKKPSDEPEARTLAKAAEPKPTSKVSVKAAPAKPRTPAPIVTPLDVTPEPVFARYARMNAPVPSPGNTTAAQAEFLRGAEAHGRGDAAAAVVAYRKAIALDPAHFAAHHNLSLAALQQGDVTNALRSAEVALAIDPRSHVARYNFAVALQRARHPLDAAEELERVTRQQPNEANAHLALASLCDLDLRDATRARAHYQRVLELQPGHPKADFIRSWLEQHPGR